MFSCFSRYTSLVQKFRNSACLLLTVNCSYLDKHNASTKDQLRTALQSSFTPSPWVLDVWYVKQWLGKPLEDIPYHTRPHLCRFKMVKRESEIKQKYWRDDFVWIPEPPDPMDDDNDSMDDQCVCIFKEDHTLPATIPIQNLQVMWLPNLDYMLILMNRPCNSILGLYTFHARNMHIK